MATSKKMILFDDYTLQLLLQKMKESTEKLNEISTLLHGQVQRDVLTELDRAIYINEEIRLTIETHIKSVDEILTE